MSGLLRAPTLRDAHPAEARALAELQARVTRHAYKDIFPADAAPPEVEQLERDWVLELSEPDRLTTVCDLAGEIVGVALAGPDLSDPTSGRIRRLYVAPEWWGRGIGRALLDRSVEYLRRCSCKRAALWVLERNTRARAWYEHLGWEFVGDRRSYAQGRVYGLGYELPITGSTDARVIG